MGDSSDDDVPLGARHKVHAVVHDLDSDSDKGSPVPDWISQHTTPLKTQQRESTADSKADDEVLDLVSQQPESQATQVEADVKQLGEAWKPNGINKSLIGTRTKSPTAGKKGTAASRAQTAASVLPTAGASQPFPVAAIPEAAAAGEVPILIPEKLAKGRWLVELDPSDTGATDLTGDAGAVGRFSVIGKGDEQELLLDLKGVIYSASLNRAATTLCVVSLANPSEARVEALMDSYISLREETAAGGGANPGPVNNNDFFIFDDDDLYQADQFREEGAGMAAGKRKAKAEAEDAPKPKKKAGGSAGGGKGTTAKRKAPAKKAAKGGGTKGGKKK